MKTNIKKDAFFFKHDSNAQDDPKLMLLIEQMQMEGVGIFWCLVEKLRSEKDYTLPFSVIPSFARRWGTSKEKIMTVINGYDLFVIIGESFFSARLTESMNYKTKTAIENANKRWGKNNATAMQPHSNGNPTAMQLDSNRNATGMLEDKIRECICILYSNTPYKQIILDKEEESSITQLDETFAELEKQEGEENFTDNQKLFFMYLVVEMVRIFRQKNPHYFFSKEADFSACLQIAYNIAATKGWSRSSVVSEKRDAVLESWNKIIDILSTNDYLATRTLRDISTVNEWQRLVQKMARDSSKQPAKTEYQNEYERKKAEYYAKSKERLKSEME